MATVEVERTPLHLPQVEPRRRTALWRWLRWGAGGLVAIVLPLVGIGATYQAIATANDQRRFPPPGQLVDVGGFHLHLYCLGDAPAGSPTVIFDAGGGRWSIDWRLIQPAISQTTRACVYDRAGLGWSDPSPHPRTSRQMMTELHTLLQNAAIAPPYLLVGHSLGGQNIRIYADAYPDEVMGLALIESAHEEQWMRLPPGVKQFRDDTVQQLAVVTWLARLGILRLQADRLPQIPAMPADLRPLYTAGLVRADYYDTFAEEVRLVDESATQVAATGDVGDLPLVVVTARHSFNAYADPPLPIAESDQVWLALQEELATLSTRSAHFISESATHNITYDEPALVIQAVQQVLGMID